MKTICFDANNLAVRNLFGPDVLILDPNDKKNVLDTNYELLKFRMFDSIYKSLFRVQGVREVVLAMDDRRSWRKLYWTKYKAQRKVNREKLNLDWDAYFDMYEDFMQELKSHTPFKVIKAKDSEADDVIGALVHAKPQDFHIISTDKDFLQLSSKRVEIFNPLKKAYVDHPNPEMFLIQECLCGQAKDNIFNVKTPLDHPDGKRKPGFGEKAFEKVISTGIEKWFDENEGTRERYEFNRNLMDMKRIPEEIKRRIFREYDGYKMTNPDNIYKFIEEHKWPEYLSNFTNVENKLMELY